MQWAFCSLYRMLASFRVIGDPETNTVDHNSLTAIMPAMQIYLIETKHATRPLQRHVSSQKLHLFMMVLAEMRDNYWGADAVLRLFQTAKAALVSGNES